MLIKQVLKCNDATLADIIHKRVIKQKKAVDPESMMMLDESTECLEPDQLEELKEAKQQELQQKSS